MKLLQAASQRSPAQCPLCHFDISGMRPRALQVNLYLRDALALLRHCAPRAAVAAAAPVTHAHQQPVLADGGQGPPQTGAVGPHVSVGADADVGGDAGHSDGESDGGGSDSSEYAAVRRPAKRPKHSNGFELSVRRGAEVPRHGARRGGASRALGAARDPDAVSAIAWDRRAGGAGAHAAAAAAAPPPSSVAGEQVQAPRLAPLLYGRFKRVGDAERGRAFLPPAVM